MLGLLRRRIGSDPAAFRQIIFDRRLRGSRRIGRRLRFGLRLLGNVIRRSPLFVRLLGENQFDLHVGFLLCRLRTARFGLVVELLPERHIGFERKGFERQRRGEIRRIAARRPGIRRDAVVTQRLVEVPQFRECQIAFDRRYIFRSRPPRDERREAMQFAPKFVQLHNFRFCAPKIRKVERRSKR